MKKTLLISVLFLFAVCQYGFSKAIVGGANDTLTATFKVNGNGVNKNDIESILSGKTGIISATWEASSKSVTIKYLSAKVKLSDLHSYFALAGYDTSELRAKQSAYDALPPDKKYTRDPEKN